jgi:hypothetical protein
MVDIEYENQVWIMNVDTMEEAKRNIDTYPDIPIFIGPPRYEPGKIGIWEHRI